MNTWQLLFKQMRQRALTTVLTATAVALAVALAVAVLVLSRQSEQLFGRAEFGHNLVVSAKGSALQAVVNSTYHIEQSPGPIPYSLYERCSTDWAQYVRWAVPYALGDQYREYRVVATWPKFFAHDAAEALRQTLDDLRRQARRPTDATFIATVQAAAEAAADVDPLAHERLREAVRDGNFGSGQAAGVALLDAAYFALAGPFEYRPDTPVTLAAGRVFHPDKFEAVLGSEVARNGDLAVGDGFQVTHGGDDGHGHAETWTVTGVAAPTGTALDRLVFVSLTSFWAIPAHAESLEAMFQLISNTAVTTPTPGDDLLGSDDSAGDLLTDDAASPSGRGELYTLGADGRILLDLPPAARQVNHILLQTRGGGFQQQTLYWQITNGTPPAMAVNPAEVLAEFFDTFLTAPTRVLVYIAGLVTLVAAVSILVSIYNAVAARRREIAVLRALGATRRRVLSLVTLEAAAVGLVGALAGWAGGLVLAAAAAAFLRGTLGEAVPAVSFGYAEAAYVLGTVLLAAAAGLVPAVKAYRISVADGLAA